MSSSEYDSDETSVVIVSLNITEAETNITINGSQPKTFMKRPNEDSSISNILLGIGLATVALIALVIIIKLIQKCYKMWQEEDDNKKDPTKKSPLLPTSTSNVVRRNSSIRNPAASTHRSSLPVETLMEIRQKRLSQISSNTPPVIKKS